MAENIKIDSHKLTYHPIAVSDWLQNKNIYPIELEITPSSGCNHRCTFCAVDYTEYTSNTLPKDIILKNIKEIAPKGLKSVICAGEGEPLINKDIVDIVTGIKNENVDVAMSSNGVLLTSHMSSVMLKALTWIRFSISAASNDLYNKIHRGKDGDLQKVFTNLSDAVAVKNNQKLTTTLGVQMLLIDDNKDEVIELAKKMKEIGVDYFTVKPYSHHPLSKNDMSVDYRKLINMEKELKELETDSYKVYFRTNTMEKLYTQRSYKRCLALPFMSNIDAKGNVYPCIAYLGKEEYSYGNLHEQSFVEIWEGEKRRKVMEMFHNTDVGKDCRELCRLDEMNKYLDDLKNPNTHVNFI